MTPFEQLKGIHKLEQTLPYIREVLTQTRQDIEAAKLKNILITINSVAYPTYENVWEWLQEAVNELRERNR